MKRRALLGMGASVATPATAPVDPLVAARPAAGMSDRPDAAADGAAAPVRAAPWSARLRLDSGAVLLGLLAVWLLATLGWRPLLLPDEGRYGEVARAMLAGDKLVPLLDGLPFFHKPPLLYWIDTIAMRVFGQNAFAARIGPMLGAWVMGAALYFCLRHWSGRRSARIGLLVLATCPLYFLGAQYVNHDMLVAGLITVAILAFARALDRPPKIHLAWLLGAWAACALAMLAKGLIGFVLPALVVGPWLLWQGRWREMLRLLHPLGLLLAAAIAAPWFVAVQARYPGFYDYFFMEQHFRRFAQSSFNNVEPFWFFVLVLPLATLPWSVRVPQVLRGMWAARRAHARPWAGSGQEDRLAQASVALRAAQETSAPVLHATVQAPAGHGVGSASGSASGSGPVSGADASWPHGHAPCDDPKLLLYAWWVVAVVLFFSLPSSKLVGYVLPALAPWCALLARSFEGAGRRMRNVLTAFAVVLCLGAVAVLTWQQPRADRAIAQALAAQIRQGDTVAMLETYPYDVPFYARLDRPVIVLSDWSDPALPQHDNWRKELFDAARFDPARGAATLRPRGALPGMVCRHDGAAAAQANTRAVGKESEPALRGGAAGDAVGTLWVLARARDAGALTVVPGIAPVMERGGLGLWKAALRPCP